MKILFLTAFTPSEVGAAVKNTKIMLEKLSSNNQVDLVHFRYKHDSSYVEPNTNIRILYKWDVTIIRKIFNILLFPFVYPQFSGRFNWLYLYKIKRLTQQSKYDVVICDHSQMFLYAKFFNRNIHKVLISHDVIAQRAQRAYNNIMYRWCVFSERLCLNVGNSRIFSFSDKDRVLIKELYGYDSFVSHAYLEKNVLDVMPQQLNNDFVMFGMWGRSDNLEGALWLLNKVPPLLHSKINIKIIGKGFPTEKLQNLHPNINVEYLGFVDNPYVIIANSKAVLAPVFTGAGLKAKVAESLACGAPVIGTEVALEGLPEECAEWMPLANNEVEFAKCIENTNYSLESRLSLKKQFLDCFDKDRVPDYVNTIKKTE